VVPELEIPKKRRPHRTSHESRNLAFSNPEGIELKKAKEEELLKKEGEVLTGDKTARSPELQGGSGKCTGALENGTWNASSSSAGIADSLFSIAEDNNTGGRRNRIETQSS